MLKYYSLKVKLKASTFLHLFPGWMCKLRTTCSGNLMPFRFILVAVEHQPILQSVCPQLHHTSRPTSFIRESQSIYGSCIFFFPSLQSEDTSLGISRSLCPAESMSCKNTITNPNYCLPGSIPLSPSLPFFPPPAGTRDDVVITSADCWCAADGSTCLHAGREIRDCAAHVQGCN